jgi:hypothetical protein
MLRKSHTLSMLTTAIAAAALAAPATAVTYEDLRNPDSKAAAIEAQREQPVYQDLRNPDSKAAAIEAQRGTPAETPAPPTIAQSPGFDWGDAGIGAGSALGLLLIALSVSFTVAHRRNRTATT